MRSAFAGFPREAMTFLRALKKNNEREWFQPRKHIYDHVVKAPMVELVAALMRDMAEFAPEHIADPAKAIYRIYRDTRFSNDKTPYKTHIAAVFPRRGLEKHGCAGYYFSVAPDEIEVAGGVYMPTPENLLALRRYLQENHEGFRKLIASRALRKLMGEIHGEQLARVPKGFPPDHPAADLLRYKQFLFYISLQAKLATTPALLPELSRRFRAMSPFIDFLNRPLLKSRPAG